MTNHVSTLEHFSWISGGQETTVDDMEMHQQNTLAGSLIGVKTSSNGEHKDLVLHNALYNGSRQVGVGEKFKPGWRDIFRMNQKELEAAIRKVSSDSSLDPRRKAYLMQNLMTR
jgi:hypothetical protein